MVHSHSGCTWHACNVNFSACMLPKGAQTWSFLQVLVANMPFLQGHLMCIASSGWRAASAMFLFFSRAIHHNTYKFATAASSRCIYNTSSISEPSCTDTLGYLAQLTGNIMQCLVSVINSRVLGCGTSPFTASPIAPVQMRHNAHRGLVRFFINARWPASLAKHCHKYCSSDESAGTMMP